MKDSLKEGRTSLNGCVLLFPGKCLGASLTYPLHSGDDQHCSLHDHCE